MPITASPEPSKPTTGRPGWRLVVHGGAGVLDRAHITPDEDAATRRSLDAALEAGAAILASGGRALDAVEASARALEDDPHFNAGRGSVFTYQGTIELDAAIMDGRDRSAGAVTGVSATRNPISLARAVMEHSPHVLLSREGADEYSRLQGLDQAPPEYFQTEARRAQLDAALSHGDYFDIDVKYGTVGAVALDGMGHVAAATSTGGLTGKRWGRIGDSPIIGAGTYADDRAGAVSATGAGEYFLRVGVAHEICARIRFERERCGDPPPAQAVQQIIDDVLAEVAQLGGRGGVIVVTPWGDGLSRFTTAGMYRGEASANGRSVGIYADEG